MTYLTGGMRIQPGWASQFRISLWALITNSWNRRACVALGVGHFLTMLLIGGQESSFRPEIPRMWDDKEIATIELPLAHPIGSPKHVSSQYYYKVPVRPIYKSYPLYAPGRDPSGYRDWLKQQEPQILWDDARHRPTLRTVADWIKAGEVVFDSPLVFSDILPDAAAKNLYTTLKRPVAANGVDPFFAIVIRQKGKIEVGFAACADCHTRVMPDGSIVKGAQGTSPTERTIAFALSSGAGAEKVKGSFLELSRRIERAQFEVPWLPAADQVDYNRMSAAEIAASHATLPPGVFARQRTSVVAPPHIPDLIGIKERRYLDATGLVQHRGIVDLMRYAALNQGADNLASYDGFIPSAFPDFKHLPAPSDLNQGVSLPQVRVGTRYSDEQLYALALYIYSLKPPPNPNHFDALAAHGQQVFERSGCATCHTPPLYTNNKLTLAAGFTSPPGAEEKYNILPISVGTDSTLTLKTRRGTGYYKVPSLKGVWYRSMFGHDGWSATLEDWFDSRRTRDDYVPTGFKPYSAKTYAVKGHIFRLDLSPEDRRALIAFLNTL